MTTIYIPREYSKQEILKSSEDKGRPVGKPKGSHLDDLIALRKAVLLCRLCAPQLVKVARKYQYREDPKMPVVRASCDCCREHDDQARCFLHESLIPERKPSRGPTVRVRLLNR